MAGLELINLHKHYRGVPALRGLSLSVPEGRLGVLLGPSGCGKTTTLRLIAGLEQPDEGGILLHGQDLRPLAPHRRGLAMVFQMPALYPHLDVSKNLGFTLRLQRMAEQDVTGRIEEAARTLGITPLLRRRPDELSVGEQQRVSLGKALVQQPRLWLLDEPLAALDAPLRRQLGREIVALQRRTGTTTLLVTHDQSIALAYADWLIVVREGRVQQEGPPDEVYAQPANRFVASFLGDPPMNLIAGAVREGTFRAKSCKLRVPDGLGDGDVKLGVRPEDVTFAEDGREASVMAEVQHVEFRGHDWIVEAAVGRQSLLVRSNAGSKLKPGDRIGLFVPRERCVFFERTLAGKRLD